MIRIIVRGDWIVTIHQCVTTRRTVADVTIPVVAIVTMDHRPLSVMPILCTTHHHVIILLLVIVIIRRLVLAGITVRPVDVTTRRHAMRLTCLLVATAPGSDCVVL